MLSGAAWVKVGSPLVEHFGRKDVHSNEGTMVVTPLATLSRLAPLFYEYDSVKSW